MDLRQRLSNIRLNYNRYSKRSKGIGEKISKQLVQIDKLLGQVGTVSYTKKRKKYSYERDFEI